jgi:hypothetical protein
MCGAGCLNWARPVLRGVGFNSREKKPVYSPNLPR